MRGNRGGDNVGHAWIEKRSRQAFALGCVSVRLAADGNGQAESGALWGGGRKFASECGPLMGETEHSTRLSAAAKARNRTDHHSVRLRVQMTRKCNRGFRMGSGVTRVRQQNDAVL